MQKTFTLEATVRLGAVDLKHHRAGHDVISVIETPEIIATRAASEEDIDTISNKYLFCVTYSNVSIITFCYLY